MQRCIPTAHQLTLPPPPAPPPTASTAASVPVRAGPAQPCNAEVHTHSPSGDIDSAASSAATAVARRRCLSPPCVCRARLAFFRSSHHRRARYSRRCHCRCQLHRHSCRRRCSRCRSTRCRPTRCSSRRCRRRPPHLDATSRDREWVRGTGAHLPPELVEGSEAASDP